MWMLSSASWAGGEGTDHRAEGAARAPNCREGYTRSAHHGHRSAACSSSSRGNLKRTIKRVVVRNEVNEKFWGLVVPTRDAHAGEGPRQALIAGFSSGALT